MQPSAPMIRVDPRNKKAAVLHEALLAMLKPEALPQDLCVVIGGDGFLLQVIGEVGSGHTFLGLNAGRLGFMLNDASDPEACADKLNHGAWWTLGVPRLRLSGVDTDGSGVHGLAVNDIYLERMTGQTSHLRITVDGSQVVDRVVCDGVIASTAMGSTAYSFSAGGPACHPRLRLIQLTTICSHLPRLPPITLPMEAIVEVEVLDHHRRPTRAVADGREHQDVSRIRIEDARSDIQIAWFEGHQPTDALIRKLLRST